MSQSNSKVFIIDNHPTFRYGVRRLIYENRQKVVAGEFPSFDSFLADQPEKSDLIIAAVNDIKQAAIPSIPSSGLTMIN